MPLRNLPHVARNSAADALRQRLIDEWRNPRQQGQPDIIIDQQPGPQAPVHVFVIWDEWEGLNQIERSEIITEAYEAVHGPDEVVRVTVAMGVTPQEAPRFNLASST
jgi:hypothetical protein